MLNALKKNYTIQSLQGVGLETEVELYLTRNHKLAAWTRDPKLVPPELWSYAVSLALKAGVDSLFQSLLALSGHQVGLPAKKSEAQTISH